MQLIGQWDNKPGQLVVMTEASNDERLFPEAAVKGVRLGTLFAELDKLVPASGSITGERPSRGVARAVRALNGIYCQMSVPYGDPQLSKYSQDNLGFYHLPGDANEGVMAITRFYAPSPLEAPSYADFDNALIEAYGQPDEAKTRGNRAEYRWHFDIDGDRATGLTLETCKRPLASSADGRVVAMLFESVRFYPSGRGNARDGEGRLSSKLQPRPGCGYSLEYIINRQEDGTLLDAQAVFFDHRAVASAMWADESEDLREEIAGLLARVNATAGNAPDL